MTITDAIHQAVVKVPLAAWTPAVEPDGEIRDGAWVAELTGGMLDGWPKGMRLIVRKERPHPGAQLRITDGDGMRITCIAAESRVRAAVLGLAGAEVSAETAARITVPVEFLVQWDDERVPRTQSLALFGAFASTEKTLHANPGKHGEVPAFEIDSTLRFFARHLG
jgi:hypothetical protein